MLAIPEPWVVVLFSATNREQSCARRNDEDNNMMSFHGVFIECILVPL